ncbi:MAG: hypothetical protein CMM50_01325 [Rhodospirillaceae bacterium]|nr:hypothetical protein [Rhodospirillaceae bacterium]
MTAPLRLAVYTAVSAASENRPVSLGAAARVKRGLSRVADLLAWTVAGRFTLRQYRYVRRQYSNKGDIAVRLAIMQMFGEHFADRQIAWTDIGWDEMNEAMVAKVNETCDMLLIGGGFVFVDDDGGPTPGFERQLDLLSGLSVPIVSCAVGVNHLFAPDTDAMPPLTSEGEDALRRFMAMSAVVTVRDRNSRNLLSRFSDKPVGVLPDFAFYLHPKPAPAPASRKPVRIGCNFAFHSKELEAVQARTLRPAIAALKALAAELDAEICHFTHSDAEQAVTTLMRLSGLPVTAIEGGPAELLDHYGRMDIHFAEMMHSAILAMSCGVPTVALAYDVKTPALYDFVGLPALCLARETTADALLDALRAAHADRIDIAGHLKAWKADMAGAYDDFFLAVGHFLPTGAP